MGQGAASVDVTDSLTDGTTVDVSISFSERIDNQHITVASTIDMSRLCVLREEGSSLVVRAFSEINPNSAAPTTFIGGSDVIVKSISSDGKTLFCQTSNPNIFSKANIDQTIAFLQENVIIESRSDLFGDALRDKFMSINMISINTNQDKLVELYSVNTEYTHSKLDSSS